MLAWCLMRLVRGAAALVLSWGTLYTILVYMPNGFNDHLKLLEHYCCCSTIVCRAGEVEILRGHYKLDRPWPLSMATWLFDPQVALHPPIVDAALARGQDSASLDVNKGVLTGDFGTSINIRRGTPVRDLLDYSSFTMLFGGLLSLIVVSMGVAVFQRRGRLPVYQTGLPPNLLLR